MHHTDCGLPLKTLLALSPPLCDCAPPTVPQVESIVKPILEKEGLCGLDPDEAVTEQSRQRLKMQVRRMLVAAAAN